MSPELPRDGLAEKGALRVRRFLLQELDHDDEHVRVALQHLAPLVELLETVVEVLLREPEPLAQLVARRQPAGPAAARVTMGATGADAQMTPGRRLTTSDRRVRPIPLYRRATP